MKNRLFSLFGIDHGEEAIMTQLLAQSVFLGIFFGAFDIGAHSFFLSVFDVKMMARGYILSGLAGIIFTLIYARLQTKLIFRNFVIIILSFVTAITLLLWIILLLRPLNWVVFLIFIMLGPLNILAMLGFRGTLSRIFTIRQEKRLFRLADAGLIAGIIIISFAIPVLISLNFRLHNILLASTAAILTATMLQLSIGSHFLPVQVKSEKASERTGKGKSLLALFREDHYIRTLGIFIVLSVMTAFFIQYSFMAVTREQYPAEADLARFLGLFTGSMMIFTLLIKIFVFSYLVKNYGLRTCLVLSPLVVAAFAIIAVTIGKLMGYTPATSGFIIFFIVLALSRIFSKSFKDSIESPSFKVTFLGIDEKIRYGLQTTMAGTINEIAVLLSGLVLTGIGILSFIRLIHFSIVLIIITGLWGLAALRLYSEYRKSIRKTLETGSLPATKSKYSLEEFKSESRFASELAFNDNYFSLSSGDYRCLGRFAGSRFLNKILDHSETRKDLSMVPLLKRIASDQNAGAEIRQRSAMIAESLEHMSYSGNQKDDRYLFLQKLLSDSRQPQTTQLLKLLRDSSFESKDVAIMLIGKFRMTELLPEVCECLNTPQLRAQAIIILKSFGRDAFRELQRYYMVSSGNIEISKIILRLLAEGCLSENQNFLFPRLWSNSRQVKETTLRLLVDCDFKAPAGDKDRMLQLISDIIGIIVWNLSARICLEKNKKALLLKALNKEINRWNEFLFNLLSIIYDSGSIDLIRENLSNGTVESVNYALEMTGMVVDDSFKPKLIPLLDDATDEKKLKNLCQFFPRVVPDYKKLVNDIMNRDYNLLGIWIRACAIRNINEIRGEYFTESVTALLFSPEDILQEESARLIARSDREIYRSASLRINSQIRKRLDRILNNEITDKEMLYEKVNFLSSCFALTDEDYLLRLAASLRYIKGINAGSLPASGGFILWPLSHDDTGGKAIIVNDPSETGKEYLKENEEFYLLPLIAVEEFHYQYPEQSSSVINFIEINEN